MPGHRSRSQLRLLALVSSAGGALLALAAWAFLEDSEAVLFAVALIMPVLAVLAYRRAERISGEARKLALTDRLTGLGNDRHFAERLEAELGDASRTGRSLTLCLIDVDDFKRINDRYGHPAGDWVLAVVGSTIRAGGEGFRLGGDEFAILLPGRRAEEGLAVADRVIERISIAEQRHGSVVTASVGIATFPRDTADPRTLIAYADAALYQAKRAGKARARAYDPEVGDSSESMVVAMAAGLLRPSACASEIGNLAAKVARRLRLPAEHVELVRVAGTLNDIGKLALPEELLSKPGPLTVEERRVVERHPQIGFRILESLGVDSIATWVLHHHERWDGAGYPGRLAGERIPLASRILFAADAYDAMTTDQAWRPRLSREEALDELERCSGTQFDPQVVEAFVAELRAEEAGALLVHD